MRESGSSVGWFMGSCWVESLSGVRRFVSWPCSKQRLFLRDFVHGLDEIRDGENASEDEGNRRRADVEDAARAAIV